MKLQRQYCNMLIKEKLVKPYDVIRHSYGTYAMKHKQVKLTNGKDRNVCSCLSTHSDTLGVVVYD